MRHYSALVLLAFACVIATVNSSAHAATQAPPPTITTFSPANATVGQSITITGTNLAGATAVAFNRVAATYTVDGPISITAKVPSGATYGRISVTTPTGTATSVARFASVVPVQGLVAYYPFSGSADDASPRGGHDGVVKGATLTADRFGVPNSAYVFNGRSDDIVANAANLPGAERTVSLWFNASALPPLPSPVLLGYGGGDCGTSFWMNLNSGKGYLISGHCGKNTFLGPAELPLKRWTHWVVTTAPDGTRFYVDGALIYSNPTYISNTDTPYTSLALGVAVDSEGVAPYADANVGWFSGALDDIRIYKRALTADEVGQLYHEGGWPNVAGVALVPASIPGGVTAPAAPVIAPRPSAGAEAAASANADQWFVELDGSNGYHASPGVPDTALTALKQAQAAGRELGSFAFTPDGDWVLLHDKGFEASEHGIDLYDQLLKMYQEKDIIQCVAFAPAGAWIMLWGGNGLWGPGSSAWTKVSELLGAGHKVRSVTFGPGDSFVILYDKAGISYGGIPNDLTWILDDAVKHNTPLQCVAFSGRDWICLGQDAWWTSNKDLPAAKLIDQNYKLGRHPKWIAFVPRLGRFNPAKFAAAYRETMAGKLAGGYACEVIDHGQVVVALHDGWVRAPWEPKDPSVPWTLDKPLEIASVSKAITAVAVMKLWEERASAGHPFSLDEPFWPYLRALYPDVHEDIKHITFRRLLNHSSGFGKELGINPKQLYQLLMLPLAHPPGTVSLYMNINYYILRLLIEQISHEDYTAYVKSHVLAPMGITGMDTHSEMDRQTCLYLKPGARTSGDEGYVDMSATAGPFGWYASASDLGRFLEGIRHFTVLSPAATKLMFHGGFGWDRSEPWAKGGSWGNGRGASIHTGIAFFPDGVDFVILLNCEPAVPTPSEIQVWKDARD